MLRMIICFLGELVCYLIGLFWFWCCNVFLSLWFLVLSVIIFGWICFYFLFILIRLFWRVCLCYKWSYCWSSMSCLSLKYGDWLEIWFVLLRLRLECWWLSLILLSFYYWRWIVYFLLLGVIGYWCLIFILFYFICVRNL